MPQQDPLEPLLDQIANLMKLAEDNASKPFNKEQTAALEKRLEYVEDMVARFKEASSKLAEDQGTDLNQALNKFRANPNLYKANERKIIQRCLELGLNAAILKAALKRAGKSTKGIRLISGESSVNSRSTIQKRKKKFKGFGRDPKWKKL